MSDSRSYPATADPAEPSRLRLTALHLDEMVAHCLAAYPDEGCGLLTGDPVSGAVAAVHATVNVAASAQLYTVDPGAYLRIDRAAEAAGQAVIGVFHSHTHTDPYPSPTDVRQAPDPSWHYVLVSLRHEVASVRSYRIVEGLIAEESIEVVGR
jgi:[CysO sulfur-carrier protein]-S-L-cysteine hydrolase